MRPISTILLLGLGSCSFAYAQINTDGGTTIPGTGIDPSHLPAVLSLVDVGDPEVSFYQAPGEVRVMVAFEASVQNNGGDSGEFLIIATANVQSETKWIDAPESLLKSTSDTFDCSGSDPFAGGFVANADLSTEMPTPFVPHVHGFNFYNSFQNNVSTPFDFRTGGLCGGMVYAALDYYYFGREIPQQDYRPADHTLLHRYIYGRNATAVESNLDHWFELRQNLGGVRNTTIFNWGLAERLDDIREFIDRGEPAALGLKGANSSGDHQVLAVGYNLGRFTGGDWANRGEMRVYVYDPNYANRRMTLVPDLDREIYYYEEVGSELGDVDGVTKIRNYQSYFVDRNYHRESPPPIPNPVYDDDLVHELVIRFDIGNDDLREGSQVDATIVFNEGSAKVARDVNGGRRWLEHYNQTISIPLETPTSVHNLRELRVEHKSGGTGGPDNWDVDGLQVKARGAETDLVYDLKAAPLVRFTDTNRGYIAYLNTAVTPDSHIRQLNFTFVTGGDNLRGGNDNLDVEVMYHDGRFQRARAVNGFLPWPNNTTSTYQIALAEPGPLSEIRGARLIKSPGNDDWNLDALRIEAVPKRGERFDVLNEARTPLVRFTERYPVQEFLFDP